MLHPKIKDLRKSRGISQEAMAAAMHKSHNAWSDIECNKSKLDAELIPDICNFFQINVEDLFEGMVNFQFNEKLENCQTAYNQTLKNESKEMMGLLKATISLLETELAEKNKTIQHLIGLVK